MSQAYTLPVGTDARSTAIKTLIPGCLDALRSCFSGATAPSNPVAYQFWADTSTGLLKQRNAANSAWEIVGPLAVNASRLLVAQEYDSLAASADRYIFVAPSTCIVEQVVLVSDTGTSSSSGNEWQWELHNLTAANELFSNTVGTFTSLGGVGGGNDLIGDQPEYLVPDQNAQISAGDLLMFRWQDVGAVTAITRATVLLQAYPRG